MVCYLPHPAPGVNRSQKKSFRKPLKKKNPASDLGLGVAKRSPTNSDNQAAGEKQRNWQQKISDTAWARNKEQHILQLIFYWRMMWSCYISVCPSEGFTQLLLSLGTMTEGFIGSSRMQSCNRTDWNCFRQRGDVVLSSWLKGRYFLYSETLK